MPIACIRSAVGMRTACVGHGFTLSALRLGGGLRAVTAALVAAARLLRSGGHATGFAPFVRRRASVMLDDGGVGGLLGARVGACDPRVVFLPVMDDDHAALQPVQPAQ